MDKKKIVNVTSHSEDMAGSQRPKSPSFFLSESKGKDIMPKRGLEPLRANYAH